MERLVLAIPNISEGRDEALVRRLAAGTVLLDLSIDPDHNRSVATLGSPATAETLAACIRLARLARDLLDVTAHAGAHPRYGVLDVLAVVPYGSPEEVARRFAAEVTEGIEALGVPVYRYGRGSSPDRSLPEVRRFLRTSPHRSHPTAGVVCLGVRDPLVAFNVNFRGHIGAARDLARNVRAPEVRALGFPLTSRGLVQVSMNLIEPSRVGPRTAFDRLLVLAKERDLELVDCEIVGLVPEPVMPELEGLPLRQPARSIEQALRG